MLYYYYVNCVIIGDDDIDDDDEPRQHHQPQQRGGGGGGRGGNKKGDQWVAQVEYDELSALCDKLMDQQEELQSELQRQADLIKVT